MLRQCLPKKLVPLLLLQTVRLRKVAAETTSHGKPLLEDPLFLARLTRQKAGRLQIGQLQIAPRLSLVQLQIAQLKVTLRLSPVRPKVVQLKIGRQLSPARRKIVLRKIE